MALYIEAERLISKAFRKLTGTNRHFPDCTRIQLILTEKCNLHCFNCDISCTQAVSEDQMSLGQIHKFVEESLALRWRWRTIDLLGGEPTIHPDFFGILSALKKYKDRHPRCNVQLWTNGFGPEVNRVLAQTPAWVCVQNTNKQSRKQEFCSFNMAPLDLAGFKDKDFSMGCSVLENCGIGLSRSGYYPCCCASGIDRIFGFDAGIANLHAVSGRVLKRHLRAFCGLCGHFKRNFAGATTVDTPQLSASWEKAYAAYRQRAPTLKSY